MTERREWLTITLDVVAQVYAQSLDLAATLEHDLTPIDTESSLAPADGLTKIHFGHPDAEVREAAGQVLHIHSRLLRTLYEVHTDGPLRPDPHPAGPATQEALDAELQRLATLAREVTDTWSRRSLRSARGR